MRSVASLSFTTNAVLLAAVSVLLLSAAFLRNGVYCDDISLYRDSVRTSPMKARPHYNLARGLVIANRFDEAVLEFDKALARDSDRANAVMIYWAIFLNAERMERAGALVPAAYCFRIFCDDAPVLFHTQRDIACDHADRIYAGLATK